MNFPISEENKDWAQFNMIVEILATVRGIQDVVTELYAKQENLPFEEAQDRLYKRIDKHREEIDQKLDTDYGYLDAEKLK